MTDTVSHDTDGRTHRGAAGRDGGGIGVRACGITDLVRRSLTDLQRCRYSMYYYLRTYSARE